MPVSKPFHHNVRDMKPGPNSGYSGWAYIEDRDYAQNPAHYTRALLLILDDLRSIFDYVEPSDEGKVAFSYRIHALLMRTCIEIEANFKAILEANTFSPRAGRSLTIRDFRKIDVTHHLSSYEVMLPLWNGVSPPIRPFEPWLALRGQAAPQGIPHRVLLHGCSGKTVRPVYRRAKRNRCCPSYANGKAENRDHIC